MYLHREMHSAGGVKYSTAPTHRLDWTLEKAEWSHTKDERPQHQHIDMTEIRWQTVQAVVASYRLSR